MARPKTGNTRAALLLALFVAAVGAGGCVERELTVDSEPRGALVYLNDQEVGRTPFKKEFLWYGTYDVTVRKEGYEPLRTTAPVIAPWWQFFPIDLVPEVLPFRLNDTHHLSFTLKPTSETKVDPDRLVQRAEVYKESLESGEKPAKLPKTRPSAPTTGPAR
jgi:hypothetical protein